MANNLGGINGGTFPEAEIVLEKKFGLVKSVMADENYEVKGFGKKY